MEPDVQLDQPWPTNFTLNETEVEPSFEFHLSSSPTTSDGAVLLTSLSYTSSPSSPPWRQWPLPTSSSPSVDGGEHVSLSIPTDPLVLNSSTYASDDLLDSSWLAPTSQLSSSSPGYSNVTPSDLQLGLSSEWLLILSTPPPPSQRISVWDSAFNVSASPTDDYLFSVELERIVPLNLSLDEEGVMESGCTVLNNGTALCWAAASNLSSQLAPYLVLNASDEHVSTSPATTPGLELAPLVKQYWALLLILFPLFTVFGNVLVIMSVYKERSLHTVTNYFIVSLAVADLLVAALVMPFAVYVLVNVEWELSPTLCDFYIAMDVACSTSSIFNLVAISIDRFIAVTQPIKYAKHRNNKRVWVTIAIVWLVSAAIASPIVLGLNTSPNRDPSLCIFYNPDFIIYSSLSSFYIPCIIMVILYYKIFKAIHERAKKSAAGRHGGGGKSGGGGRQSAGDLHLHPDMVIENIAQTKRHRLKTPFFNHSRGPFFRYKETVVTLCVPVDQDQPTANTESGSQEDGEQDEMVLSNTEPCPALSNDRSLEGSGRGATPVSNFTQIDSPSSLLHPLASNMHLSPSAVSGPGLMSNGSNNHDASCECSDVTTEETTFLSGDSCSGARTLGYGVKDEVATPKPVERRPSETGERHSARQPRKSSKRNGSVEMGNLENNGSWSNRGSDRRPNSQPDSGGVSPIRGGRKPRFHLTRHHKSSRKKKEKSAAKKERKATKTLAIVIGVFLACWVPFFTCNILDAICIKLGSEWHPGFAVFIWTTWLGYMNSFINPVIYTIFNPEFRKAFKKILSGG